MNRQLTGIVLGFVALFGASGHATDFSPDIEQVKGLVQQDASFNAEERQQADALLAALSQRATTMSNAAFQLDVARVFALAGNGHSMLVAGLWPSQFNRIPVRTQVFADGIYIVHADNAATKLIGTKVLAVDSKPVELIRHRFGELWGALPSKRDDWLGYWLESPELLHAAGLALAPDRITLHLEDEQGNHTEVLLSAALQAPADGRYAFFYRSRLVDYSRNNLAPATATPLYLAEPDKVFRFATLPDLNAFYLQLRYNTNVGNQRVDDFIDAASKALKQSGAKHVIVDLRLDSGGDLNTTRDFMQALPNLIARNGRIFALVSGRTFSAGIASVGYLKQAGGDRVTIIGTPVGDELEYWAEGNLTELGVSKAEVLHATERHNYQTGCQQDDCHGAIRRNPIRVNSLAPDILAPLRYQDYRNGIDPAMAVIAEQLGR